MVIFPMSTTQANEFVVAYHRHAGPTGLCRGRFAIGLAENRTEGCKLWGVAIVGNPVARLLMDGVTAEVQRLCVREDAPPNSY